MTLSQQQKMEEQVAALEKLIACRQKNKQVHDNLSKELKRLADSSYKQLQHCEELLMKDQDRLKDLKGRLARMGGNGESPDADVRSGQPIHATVHINGSRVPI